MPAQGPGTDAAIGKKLDDILNGQRAIMQGIADLKEELRIVKIRVTQQQ
jgi:hypothetical protein